ncbi:MAG: hypothetical protein JWO58_3369 [Chitinophagaceae bacterium]|nr:hypothetical protein [Chitinophagaceae bacterium]
MINPIKRAIIIACVAVLIIITAYFIPGVKDSKFADFLKGGSVGAASVAILMVVVAIAQRPKDAQL